MKDLILTTLTLIFMLFVILMFLVAFSGTP